MIRIGPDIEVIVTRIHGNSVSLGIKAPRDVKVDREEIAERKIAYPLGPPLVAR